ncbi:Nitrogen permease regulator 2 [Malassezia pachydermatis]
MEPGQSRQGFLPRLEATFLSIFHPVDGPKVLFQMPEYTFQDAPSASATPDTLPTQRQKLMLDFISMSDYVIPKGPLCGRLIKWVVSSNASVNGRRRSYKVLGHPVLLDGSEKYERNHFIFNLCFVFTADSDVRPYEPIVRKCARLLRQLEVCMPSH